MPMTKQEILDRAIMRAVATSNDLLQMLPGADVTTGAALVAARKQIGSLAVGLRAVRVALDDAVTTAEPLARGTVHPRPKRQALPRIALPSDYEVQVVPAVDPRAIDFSDDRRTRTVRIDRSSMAELIASTRREDR